MFGKSLPAAIVMHFKWWIDDVLSLGCSNIWCLSETDRSLIGHFWGEDEYLRYFTAFYATLSRPKPQLTQKNARESLCRYPALAKTRTPNLSHKQCSKKTRVGWEAYYKLFSSINTDKIIQFENRNQRVNSLYRTIELLLPDRNK